MNENFFENPRPEFSQGDIFELLPHSYLRDPLRALHEREDSLFSAIKDPSPASDAKAKDIIAHCHFGNALLLTHDCEIDKKGVTNWQIVPVVALSNLAAAVRGDVKRNRVYSLLHVPAHGELQESFVDFNRISTIEAGVVRQARRLTSLSDDGRRALYTQWIRWMSRWELRKLECPACHNEFEPSSTQSVRKL